MNVICLDEQAFYSLIEEVVDRLKEKEETKGDKWISGKEAMKNNTILLNHNPCVGGSSPSSANN